MDWLLDSPVAQLHRFYFLAFYAVVIALTAFICHWLTRRDATESLTTPALPETPDPYEIAYLRGGVNETTRAVVFKLVQDNYLTTSANRAGRIIQRADEAPAALPPHLPPLEHIAFDWVSHPRLPKQMFDSNGLVALLQPYCAPYEDKLQREQLLRSPEALTNAARARWLGVCGVAGLGVYKLLVALAQGRSNVGFLIVLGIIGALLVWRATRPLRLTARGRKYLANLQLAFERLKYSLPPQAPSTLLGASVGPEASIASGAPYLLALGVFGVTALEGTAYADYPASFQRAATAPGDVGGGGSSCGSGSSWGGGSSSCGSSSSCSGGSSCGGGGCGGGGCGG